MPDGVPGSADGAAGLECAPRPEHRRGLRAWRPASSADGGRCRPLPAILAGPALKRKTRKRPKLTIPLLKVGAPLQEAPLAARSHHACEGVAGAAWHPGAVPQVPRQVSAPVQGQGARGGAGREHTAAAAPARGAPPALVSQGAAGRLTARTRAGGRPGAAAADVPHLAARGVPPHPLRRLPAGAREGWRHPRDEGARTSPTPGPGCQQAGAAWQPARLVRTLRAGLCSPADEACLPAPCTRCNMVRLAWWAVDRLGRTCSTARHRQGHPRGRLTQAAHGRWRCTSYARTS